MRKLYGTLVAALVALSLIAAGQAQAQVQVPRVFVTVLSSENEVPGCPQGVESGARGLAVILIKPKTGEIRYWVVAWNLPGTIAGSPGAHIHVGAPGEAGPIVQPLQLTGREVGLVAAGTATNPALAQAILANPENYYVNVHTTVCPAGAIRGQLG
ncbi:MAG: CHRD domain-containing protein [Actinomycetota bacterium]|nr:CHRD domain-containing protein [Actinomycetota bacterium]